MRNINYKFILAAASIAGLAITASAQSAIDAYNMTPTELRGSARFVGMGGAFTSLGGDLTTMTQNPAGIGTYRHSDVGLGFSISMRKNTATTDNGKYANNDTRGYFDYAGYVGATKLNSPLRFINWGVSYNRLASYDRRFNGYNRPTSTSLTNYIASFTDGVNSDDLLSNSSTNYDAYLDSDCDWLSILAYDSYMINNAGSNSLYNGLFQNGTDADAEYMVRERGYVDEYNIDLGGNVEDVVYWGLGVGIVDMNFHSETDYSESLGGALIYTGRGDDLGSGNAGFGLSNRKTVSGTGANLKVGIIVRPVEMLRLGLAFHTPTWMHLRSVGNGSTTYNYTPDGDSRTLSGFGNTPNFDYDWRLRTPWRFMVGASVLMGSKAILSVDYEQAMYANMGVKYSEWGIWGQNFVDDERVNSAIKEQYKSAQTIRVGLEYRLTRSLSARAGFNYQMTNVREAADNGQLEINTAGTDPSYVFNKDNYNFCVGLGYRYQMWYIDATYQHTRVNSTYHAYTPFGGNAVTPNAAIATNHNNIVISTGLKF